MPAQTHLNYYAQHFSCVEINSSFYRPHRAATYARWRDETPANFRFAVKMPRSITHEGCLRRGYAEISRFYEDVSHLQPKLGAVLVQLPPSLEYSSSFVRIFFKQLTSLSSTAVTCEPRHSSWFSKAADDTLRRLGISRVAADPARAIGSDVPGGADRLDYFRWHGSPRMYYSTYTGAQLAYFADQVRRAVSSEAWCIFDNTARYAAWDDALRFIAQVRDSASKFVRKFCD